jgi:hypothetical protein
MKLSEPQFISASGKTANIYPTLGGTFSLEELQQYVGGMIEIVALDDGRVMVLNEEGKLLNLPYNAIATELFNQGGRMWWEPIAGDVVVCEPEYLESDDDDEDEPDGDDYYDV